MSKTLDHHDVVLAGGGLSSGVLAYRLAQMWPHLKILILEKGQRLGGQHTWSFHQHDLTLDQHRWIAPFVTQGWAGYSVEFPNLRRILSTAYYSIRSEQFHEVVTSVSQIEVRTNTSVKSVESGQVELEDGTKINAPLVIDGRGFSEKPSNDPMGYQKFVGLDVTLAEPHGLHAPIIMDATCDQTDGYRFFYLLPWNETQLLIQGKLPQAGTSIT
jgi:lycopene beta-cyclase